MTVVAIIVAPSETRSRGNHAEQTSFIESCKSSRDLVF